MSRSTAGENASRSPLIVLSVVTGFVSLLELLLVDRKYGVFSGGFNQSRAVDTPVEILAFLLAYWLAQILLALLVWLLIQRLFRRQSGWPVLLHFSAAMGGGFVLALALQYQLHSYFSDAVSLSLIKQLGGGSIRDAFLFALHEIGIALIAILIGLTAYWLAWKWLLRRFPVGSAVPVTTVRARGLVMVFAAFILAAQFMPRLAVDAAHGLNRTLAWRTFIAGLDFVTDFDKDGYGLFAILRDNAPFDAKRYPLALDVPGNGIDEDGLGGDLILEEISSALPHTNVMGNRLNLVLVIFESARSDVLGKRINGKPVAPTLDAIAASGSMTNRSYAHVAYTTNSLKSIFTGQLSPSRGVPSLFSDLKQSGYRVGVFSGQPEDFGDISATVGMRENASIFVDAEVLKEQRAFSFAAKGSLLVDENHLLAAFDREFGEAKQWQQPTFLYFNFQSPHFPYHHDGVVSRLIEQPISRSAINAANRIGVENTYFNAVANADYWLAELVRRLKSLGVWENTLLIVSGDHGEDLFEDGFLGHGHIINSRQFGTFLVANRTHVVPTGGVVSLSDYRGIILDALSGKPVTPVTGAAFMYIGELSKPTQIGLADSGGGLTTLRLDTYEACLVDRSYCSPYNRLDEEATARVNRLVQRWGSERWVRYVQARQAQASEKISPVAP